MNVAWKGLIKMAFEVINYIKRKKAGMSLLCKVISNDLENKAKDNAKWTDRTAHARQGLHGETESSSNQHTIYIAYGVDYGEVLEEGSKPHVIEPKNKKYLYWKGAAHPVKKVNHPGTKGFHTVEDTLKEGKEKTLKIITEYWSD